MGDQRKQLQCGGDGKRSSSTIHVAAPCRLTSLLPPVQVLPRLHRLVGYNQEVTTVILRLVSAGHDDVAFKLLQTMVRSENAAGESVSVGSFFVRQMVRAQRVSGGLKWRTDSEVCRWTGLGLLVSLAS